MIITHSHSGQYSATGENRKDDKKLDDKEDNEYIK